MASLTTVLVPIKLGLVIRSMRLRHLDIKLSVWSFRALQAAEVLPISREYFGLRRPLDRRA